MSGATSRTPPPPAVAAINPRPRAAPAPAPAPAQTSPTARASHTLPRRRRPRPGRRAAGARLSAGLCVPVSCWPTFWLPTYLRERYRYLGTYPLVPAACLALRPLHPKITSNTCFCPPRSFVPPKAPSFKACCASAQTERAQTNEQTTKHTSFFDVISVSYSGCTA